MATKLRCPACRDTFPWDVKLGMPKVCPLCAERVGHDRADDDIVMPFIRTKSPGIDRVYRDMEAGSEKRAAMAAEMAGVPVSEMSDLKITNLRDGQREGDVSAPPVVNDVTRFMQQTGVGGFRGADGSGYSGAVQAGPFANSGAKMRTALQNHHTELSRGSAVSDVPAIETTQPGYRRRG